MKKKQIVLMIALGLLIGIGYLFLPTDNLPFSSKASERSDRHAQLITSVKPIGGDFTLDSVDGPHSLSDYNGKLVLLYFGYTYCPDICPTNLGNLSMAYQSLTQSEKDNLQILFISVDPDRDTVDRLQKYASYFEADIVGLTGQKNSLAEIAKRYGVVYAKVEDPHNGTNYAVDHSAFTYVIDKTGQLQTQLPHATSPDDFIKVIHKYQSNATP